MARPLTILGIDPGLRVTGWGLLRCEGSRLTGMACGLIKPDEKAPLAARLGQLAVGLEALLAEHQPGEAAVEEIFVNVNAQSTLKLGLARGALLGTLGRAGLVVGEYKPSQIKQCVTGYGRAEKAQVGGMVARLLPTLAAGIAATRHDAADALAIAITHALLRKSKLLAAGAQVHSHP